MPYLFIFAGLATLFLCYGLLQFFLRKRPTKTLTPFATQRRILQYALTGLCMSLLLLLGALVSAAILFLFLTFLLFIGGVYLLLTVVQKKDTTRCAQGMQTLAKQGGQFFMTLFALFVEFVLQFVGIAENV